LTECRSSGRSRRMLKSPVMYVWDMLAEWV